MNWITDLIIPIIFLWPVFVGVGAAVLHSIKRYETVDSGLSFLALSFFFGAGLVTFGQFLLSLVNIPLHVSLVGFFFVAWWGWKYVKQNVDVPIPSLFSVLSWIGISLMLMLLFVRLFSRPMYTWDAVAFWMPKMFALWQDQKVSKHTLEYFNHPEYPLLVPLIGADTYTAYNFPNEVAVKVVLFGFTLAFVGLLWWFVSLHHKKPWGLVYVLFFLSLFIVKEHTGGEYVGTADILVGLYAGVGSLLLLSKKPYQALLMWAFVPWAKTEGLVWAGSTFVLTLFFFWKTLLSRWKQVIIVPFIFSAWFFYTKIIGLSSQYFKFSELYARPWVEYGVYSVHAFREEFRNISRWNLLFFFFFGGIGMRIRTMLKHKELLVILLALAAQVMMYMVIFTIAPEEQASFIAAAVSRLTLHIAPTVMIVTAYVFGKVYEHEDSI